MCLNIVWPSFLHNLMTDFYFLKGELLIGDWKATESAMKVDWIVTEMCLPFSTFQSLKGGWKSHFSKNWNVGFFAVLVALIVRRQNCLAEFTVSLAKMFYIETFNSEWSKWSWMAVTYYKGIDVCSVRVAEEWRTSNS